MSSIKNNLSQETLIAPEGVRIGIVQSEYNGDITNALLSSCLEELDKAGVQHENIKVIKVPGAWELPVACQMLANDEKPHAVIALGAIIKGETPHFDFIANQVAAGIMDLSLKLTLPIIFGVLTPLNLSQAEARIKGGEAGDKGVEAAQTAIKMINLSLKKCKS